MDILDTPINLTYSNGKLFPNNAVFSGYVLLAVSVFSLVMGSRIIGLVLILIGSLISFSKSDLVFNPDKNAFYERTFYLGFIPTSKTFDVSNWQLITVIPSRQTQTMYARSSTSTSVTDVYFVVALLKSNYRGKKELIKFENKSRSYEVAKGIGERFGLVFFEYNPQTIREAYQK